MDSSRHSVERSTASASTASRNKQQNGDSHMFPFQSNSARRSGSVRSALRNLGGMLRVSYAAVQVTICRALRHARFGVDGMFMCWCMPRASRLLTPVSHAAAPRSLIFCLCVHCSATPSHSGLMSALQRERGPGASRSWFNPEESTQQKASLGSYHLLLAKQLHPHCNSNGDSLAAIPLPKLRVPGFSMVCIPGRCSGGSRAWAAYWQAAAA